MDNPKLYLQNKENIVRRSEHFFKKYFGLLPKSNAKKSVLDIGSGPGNVTHDILCRYFKFNVKEVIGIDRSEAMVQYANDCYRKDKISFRVFDICNTELEDLVGRFDYVFSFWALHWVEDQRALYSNIYQVMKPNADLLLWYVAKSELYDVYKTVWFKPQYIKYIKDLSGLEPKFQQFKNPVDHLEAIIKDVGFEVHLCQTKKWRSSNYPSVKDLLISINPAYKQLPEDLGEDFIMDHVEEMKKRGRFMCKDEFLIDYEMFIVCAKKKISIANHNTIKESRSCLSAVKRSDQKKLEN